jgi:hypothetical protein
LKRKILFLGFCIYSIIQILGAFKHTPWRDEVWAWLATADSPSIQTMFYRSNLEIYPFWFHLLLSLLHLITDNFFVYKLFFVFVSLLTGFLIVNLYRVSFYLKLFLLFNYYSIFEYGIIQRTYSLQLLLLMVAVQGILHSEASIKNRTNNYLRFGTVGLLAFSPWSLLLGVMVVGIGLARNYFRVKTGFFVLCLLLSLFNLLSFLLPMGRDWNIPKQNFQSWIDFEFIYKLITAPIRSLVILPRNQIDFWNTSYLDIIPLIVTLVSIALLTLFLLNFRFIFNHYGWASLVFLAILFATVPLVALGKQRHVGQFFLIIILICVPIWNSILNSLFLGLNQKSFLPNLKSSVAALLLFSIFSSHIYATGLALINSSNHPFSRSYLLGKEIKYDDGLIAYDGGYALFLPALASSIKSAYMPLGDRYSMNFLQNKEAWQYVSNNNKNPVCSDLNNERLLLLTSEAVVFPSPTLSGKKQIRISQKNTIEAMEDSFRIVVLAEGKSEIREFCERQNWLNFMREIEVDSTGYGASLKN